MFCLSITIKCENEHTCIQADGYNITPRINGIFIHSDIPVTYSYKTDKNHIA